jgi:hypothetical protein
MIDFNVQIKLPSGDSINVKELKNKDFFTILKFCENSDLRGLNDCFLSLFDVKYSHLNIIDKFYTLLTYRMLFIDPEIAFKSGDSYINLNIADILHKIDQTVRDYTCIYTAEKFTLELDLPNIIYFTDVDEIFTCIIKAITLNGKRIIFNEIDKQQQAEILSLMPNTCFRYLVKYIDTISKHFQSFVLIEGNSDFNISEVNINILSNGFLNFICGIYSTGLQNFLELLYYSASKLHITGDTFFSLTPLDSRVLFNIYNKDIDNENKQMQTLKTDYPE